MESKESPDTVRFQVLSRDDPLTSVSFIPSPFAFLLLFIGIRERKSLVGDEYMYSKRSLNLFAKVFGKNLENLYQEK